MVILKKLMRKKRISFLFLVWILLTYNVTATAITSEDIKEFKDSMNYLKNWTIQLNKQVQDLETKINTGIEAKVKVLTDNIYTKLKSEIETLQNQCQLVNIEKEGLKKHDNALASLQQSAESITSTVSEVKESLGSTSTKIMSVLQEQNKIMSKTLKDQDNNLTEKILQNKTGILQAYDDNKNTTSNDIVNKIKLEFESLVTKNFDKLNENIVKDKTEILKSYDEKINAANNDILDQMKKMDSDLKKLVEQNTVTVESFNNMYKQQDKHTEEIQTHRENSISKEEMFEQIETMKKDFGEKLKHNITSNDENQKKYLTTIDKARAELYEAFKSMIAALNQNQNQVVKVLENKFPILENFSFKTGQKLSEGITLLIKKSDDLTQQTKSQINANLVNLEKQFEESRSKFQSQHQESQNQLKEHFKSIADIKSIFEPLLSEQTKEINGKSKEELVTQTNILQIHLLKSDKFIYFLVGASGISLCCMLAWCISSCMKPNNNLELQEKSKNENAAESQDTDDRESDNPRDSKKQGKDNSIEQNKRKKEEQKQKPEKTNTAERKDVMKSKELEIEYKKDKKATTKSYKFKKGDYVLVPYKNELAKAIIVRNTDPNNIGVKLVEFEDEGVIYGFTESEIQFNIDEATLPPNNNSNDVPNTVDIIQITDDVPPNAALSITQRLGLDFDDYIARSTDFLTTSSMTADSSSYSSSYGDKVSHNSVIKNFWKPRR